ncbi:hypothetical protein FO488_00585 [Geobacter sp. FeAm09]|uniref:carboxypeptidase regulatory-like domain-containing protein n=1 Tax=Geobacter sp. FeAm09 TaxID=2597769 RepID=UPI0011ED6FD9|nr:carboxypeptidase regulatory-like domain-containing protein [Geobacter sp. FeAm09]QEM66802.1 hypothetical protein FO488_00585 [Geobacter sp. FeAm09]
MSKDLLLQAIKRRLSCGMLLAGLLSVVFALANPAAAISATGFQGTVTNASGGLGSVEVAVFYNTGDPVPSVTSVTTAADGTYTFSGLTAGSYLVSFTSGSSTLWYKNKLSYAQGDLVTVVDGALTPDINAYFGTWGNISGRVTNASNTGIAGIQVTVCDGSGTAISTIPPVTTASDGSYTISVVPVGSSYTIKFSDSSNTYVDEWYDNHLNSGYTASGFAATRVTVSDGETTPLATAVLVTPSISGKVSNLAGTALSGITIDIFDASTFNAVTDTNGELITTVQTRADGTYLLGGVPAGSYKIIFNSAATNGYAKQYYNNKTTSLSSADTVVVTSNATTTAINATLKSTTAPTVSTFTVPATSNSLTISGITLTATGLNGVTGYLITESSTVPLAAASGWTAAAPTSYTASTSGSVTLYPWAKDANSLVSAVYGSPQTVTIALPVNGACGTANGGSFYVAPTANLCSTGTASTVSGTGPWSWTCSGTNGGTAANCSATLLAGSDTTPPTLAVSTLADGATTNNQVLNVSGTVTDAGSGIQSLTVKGQAATVASDGSFSSAVSLASGSNTIAVVATDGSGNSTTVIRTITFTASAPLLTVTSPADNSASNQSSLTVSGTVDSTATGLTVNGTSVAISGGAYSTSVSLAAGLNTISIVATAPGGTTTAKRTVSYDSSRSSLAVTFPKRDIATTQTGITLLGTVSSDVTAVTITMNGQTYTPAISSSSFQQALAFSTAGTYAITVSAAGQNSTTTTVQRNVIFSTTAVKAGDCDASGTVTIAEVQSAINMYLGLKQVQVCVDLDNSDAVSISEVQKAINAYLGL